MRKPKDKDFIETFEGLLFCVLGYLHPPNKYTAYLKYRPDPKGRWRRNAVHYRRMLQVYSAAEMQISNNWLEREFPQYLTFDRVRGIKLPLIPHDSIQTYYLPEIRLRELMAAPTDTLEVKAKKLVSELTKFSGLSADCFGISGSLLLKNHNPQYSDIDLLVFGAANTKKLRETMESIYLDGKIEPFRTEEIEQWQKRQMSILGIPSRFASQLIWPKWQRGRFDDTPFSLHPTRTDAEINEKYGRETFTTVASVELTATITDDHDSLFVPARYSIEEVTIRGGFAERVDITEIISFEGVFAGCFRQGDRIRAHGTIEAVTNTQTRKTRHRLVIGTYSSKGWIIPLGAQ